MLNYPYNPDFSATESSDARVPYYGEWVWVVAFSSGTTFDGKMSVFKRVPPGQGFFNTGFGAAVWCVSTPCTYRNDYGLISSFSDSGSEALSVSYFDTDFNQLDFIALDSDKKVGSEVGGKHTIKGTGRWYNIDGSYSVVGFAMTQASTSPPIKAASAPLLTAALAQRQALERLNKPSVTVQSETTLEQRAVETLRALLKN